MNRARAAAPPALAPARGTTVLGTIAFGVALVAGATAPVAADDFDSLDALSQEEFERLGENLGAATHFRPLSPAEHLGVLGADVAIEASSTEIDPELFTRAGDEPALDDALPAVRLHAQKGLPFRLDVGAMVAAVPGTDATLVGAELRVSLVEGGVATPAVSARASYSRLQGVTELEADNYGLELAVSKGVLMLTPYAGVGVVRTEASAPRATSLEDVSVDQRKLFAGLNVNLGANLALEVDRTGDATTWAAKLGIRF